MLVQGYENINYNFININIIYGNAVEEKNSSDPSTLTNR